MIIVCPFTESVHYDTVPKMSCVQVQQLAGSQLSLPQRSKQKIKGKKTKKLICDHNGLQWPTGTEQNPIYSRDYKRLSIGLCCQIKLNFTHNFISFSQANFAVCPSQTSHRNTNFSELMSRDILHAACSTSFTLCVHITLASLECLLNLANIHHTQYNNTIKNICIAHSGQPLSQIRGAGSHRASRGGAEVVICCRCLER